MVDRFAYLSSSRPLQWCSGGRRKFILRADYMIRCGVRLGGGAQHVCSAVVVYCLVNHSIVVLRKFYSVAQQKTGQGCSE